MSSHDVATSIGIDLTMMYAAHRAFRRDLDRAERRPGILSVAARRRVCRGNGRSVPATPGTIANSRTASLGTGVHTQTSLVAASWAKQIANPATTKDTPQGE
jgi:hypothetical protein